MLKPLVIAAITVTLMVQPMAAHAGSATAPRPDAPTTRKIPTDAAIIAIIIAASIAAYKAGGRPAHAPRTE